MHRDLKPLLDAPLRYGGKLNMGTVMRLAYGFAWGLPIKTVARAYEVSPKSVRRFYLECRDQLDTPKYEPWHGFAKLILDLPPDATLQALVKTTFFEVMASCHDNETCHRNYRLGNRQSRFCRSCPLQTHYKLRLRQAEAIHVIDLVQTFYRHLGLRKEAGIDPVIAFRQRLLHVTVISEIHAHTSPRPDGTLDPADMDEKGLGRFLLLLMDDLAGMAESGQNQSAPDAEGKAVTPEKPATPESPELADWLLDDGSVVWLPVGVKPPSSS